MNSDWKIDPKLVKNLEHIASVLTWSPDYYEKRLKKIDFFGKNTRVLDAACGSGVWAVAASYLNKQVEGIDSTQKYLAVAQEVKKSLKIKNLKLEIGKLEKLPYPDKYFDYIVCYNAWMYTNRQKSLQEMFRALKPGGKIYLGSIAGLGYYLSLIIQGFKEGKRNLILIAFKAIKDRVYMTEKKSRDLLEKQGFKILSLAADAQTGDPKIKVKPMFSAKFLGFWNTFEILVQKKKGKM